VGFQSTLEEHTAASLLQEIEQQYVLDIEVVPPMPEHEVDPDLVDGELLRCRHFAKNVAVRIEDRPAR